MVTDDILKMKGSGKCFPLLFNYDSCNRTEVFVIYISERIACKRTSILSLFRLLGLESGRMLIGMRLIDQPNDIVGGHVVEFTQANQVGDFKLCSPDFDVIIPLLGFIQEFANFPLRDIPIFAQGTYAIVVIHRIHPMTLYSIQILSIDKNSISEYN